MKFPLFTRIPLPRCIHIYIYIHVFYFFLTARAEVSRSERQAGVTGAALTRGLRGFSPPVFAPSPPGRGESRGERQDKDRTGGKNEEKGTKGKRHNRWDVPRLIPFISSTPTKENKPRIRKPELREGYTFRVFPFLLLFFFIFSRK